MVSVTARVNGIALHVEHDNLDEATRGAGGPVPLVMVHGWTADRHRNYPVYRHFKDQGWPVVCYDLRGHGWSQKGLGPDAYTLTACVDDLQALLRDYLHAELGIAEVALYGHSMGGTIVLEHASRPTRDVVVRCLVLVAAYAGWSATGDMRAGFAAMLDSYVKRYEKEFARKKREQAKLGLEFFPHWEDPSLLPERDATLALGREMLARGVAHDVLDGVRVPVHVIVGSADRPDLQADARLLAARAARATLDVLPCAHNYAIELRETFPALVLARVRGEGPDGPR